MGGRAIRKPPLSAHRHFHTPDRTASPTANLRTASSTVAGGPPTLQPPRVAFMVPGTLPWIRP